MAINSVSGVNSLLNALNATSSATTENTGTSFSELLKSALDQVDETVEANQTGTLELLSGQSTDIHTSLIEAQKAELTLNLAVQVRNKVVDAYKEIMNMQM